jgi:hydroxypyruvate isomerase
LPACPSATNPTAASCTILPYLFALIDELGYNGHIGCEYRPAAGTSAGLGWLAPYKTGDKIP